MKKIVQIEVVWLRIFWFVSAALLLSAAVFVLLCLDLHTAAIFIGACMLLAGVCDTLGYVLSHHILYGEKWLLCEGLIMSLLSIFLLFNDIIFIEFVPFLFGIWELVSGVLKSVESAMQREDKISGWQAFFVIGLIEVISGMLAMLKTVEITLTTNVTICIVLVIQAISFLYKFIFAKKLILTENSFTCDTEI